MDLYTRQFNEFLHWIGTVHARLAVLMPMKSMDVEGRMTDVQHLSGALMSAGESPWMFSKKKKHLAWQ